MLTIIIYNYNNNAQSGFKLNHKHLCKIKQPTIKKKKNFSWKK